MTKGSFCCQVLITLFGILLAQKGMEDSMEPRQRFKRIIGGSTARPGQFKSIVSLRINTKHKCAGVLIKNPKFTDGTNLVLTNAHCFAEVDKDELYLRPSEVDFEVFVGSVDSSGGEPQARYDFNTAIKDSRLGVHPNFEHPDGRTVQDLVLLPLNAVIPFSSNVQAADLATSKQERMIGTIAGWGSQVSHERGAQMSPTLQYARVTTVDPKECGVAETGRVICAYGLLRARVETADGDSGSPFYVNDKLQGIIMGAKKYKTERRILIASIVEYAPWIEQTIRVFNGEEGTSS